MKVTSSDIKRQLVKRHRNDMYWDEVKTGSTFLARNLRIMDFLAIKKSWSPVTIIGYEIKVSRSDFIRDIKWPEYLKYCHQFSFACPKGLISKDELQPGIGLVTYNPERKTIRTVRAPTYKQIDISVNLLMYLLMWKVDWSNEYLNKEDRIEYWQDWLEQKKTAQELGYHVKSKIIDEIRKTEERKERLNELSKTLKTCKQIVENFTGHRCWDLEYQLEKILKKEKKEMLPWIEEYIVKAFDNLENVKKYIDENKKRIGEG